MLHKGYYAVTRIGGNLRDALTQDWEREAPFLTQNLEQCDLLGSFGLSKYMHPTPAFLQREQGLFSSHLTLDFRQAEHALGIRLFLVGLVVTGDSSPIPIREETLHARD